MQGKISTMMSAIKTQYTGILCAFATCSSQSQTSPSPTPTEVEIMINDNQASLCSSTELQKKASSCIQNMTAAAGGGDICPAWQTYECCLRDSYASCGSEMQGKISTMMSAIKTQYTGILCASATCSSQSQTSPFPTPFSSNGASSSFNILFAAVLIFVRAAI